ncbi:MAG: hypothetical protein GY757_38005, partial [bacterium]|nr:hypothetical protein [bacterium]
IQDRLQNKMVFYYNLSGQLTTVMDTMGRLYDFEYYEFELEEDENGVEDALVKITSGRLKSITDFSGRKVAYTYDTETGDLLQVDRNSGTLEGVKTLSRKTRYKYETEGTDLKLLHNLKKIIDPRGVLLEDSPVLTVHYTAEDKVEIQDFIELDQDIVFTIAEGTTTVTDARNNTKTFTIEDEHVKSVDNSGFVTGFEYDSKGHGLVTTVTYPKQNKTKYIYDLEKKGPGEIFDLKEISLPRMRMTKPQQSKRYILIIPTTTWSSVSGIPKVLTHISFVIPMEASKKLILTKSPITSTITLKIPGNSTISTTQWVLKPNTSTTRRAHHTATERKRFPTGH